jgi:cobalamin-dependent methionine synthase I
MLIIGESINGTIPSVGSAIAGRDEAFLAALAKTQVDAGAQMLDVNAGIAGGNEVEDLPWLIALVQKAVKVPLMLDSNNPEALKKGLDVYQHAEPPILNSISGETKKMDRLLPILSSRKCRIVCLCMDDEGVPTHIEKRMAVAHKLFPLLREAGLSPGEIFFDPLVLGLAFNPEGALVTLKTMERLKNDFPDAHVTCGLSNIGIELPARKLINRSFLAMAAFAGLDTFLIDVRDRGLMASITASMALTGKDPNLRGYLKAYRAKQLV